MITYSVFTQMLLKVNVKITFVILQMISYELWEIMSWLSYYLSVVLVPIDEHNNWQDC